MQRFLGKLLGIMIPVIVLLLLIPVVANDAFLSAIYAVASILMILWGHDRKEIVFFAYGFVLMAIAEIFFVATGVETFHRAALFMGMPVWLPILWGFSFIMVRRGILALDELLD